MSVPVFVSHSSRDYQQVRALVEALEARGIPCWLSERDIPAGANYGDAIVDAIEATPAMLLVFSPHANDSDEIKKEVALASQRKITVVPIRLSDVTPSKAFRYELVTRNWIDFFPDWEGGLLRLTDRLAGLLKVEPITPPRKPPTPAVKAGASRIPLAVAAGGGVAILLVGVGFFLLRPPAPTPAIVTPTPTVAITSATLVPSPTPTVAATTPGPSPTAVATAAPSPKPSETQTPTSAPTVAETPTSSPTPTGAATTPTPAPPTTPVATATPSPTGAATPMPSSTPTPAPTATAVATVQPSPTATATPSTTPTVAATTPSPPPTSTATPAPSPTPTVAATTPSPAPPTTPVATAPPSPTATPTPSPAPTATAVTTATPSTPPSPSPTAPPSPTPTVAEPSPTPSPASPEPSPTETTAGEASPTPSGAPPKKTGPAPAVLGPPPAIAVDDPGGEVFKECQQCPEMVVVPRGSALIGSPSGEPGRQANEATPHEVDIAKPFAVGRFAISFAEWDACVASGGCDAWRPGDFDMGRGRKPVIFVSFDNANAYLSWLRRKTGKDYRLLSEAEWEYAARGCANPKCPAQPFWFGQISPEVAVYDWRYSYGGSPRAEEAPKTAPVDFGQPNPFGLYNMLGNVRQWTADCWTPKPSSARSDGAAVTTGDCGERVTRGGAWSDKPQALRAAARSSGLSDEQSPQIGFRVARTLSAP